MCLESVLFHHLLLKVAIKRVVHKDLQAPVEMMHMIPLKGLLSLNMSML